jgi:probable F420-dependent oxidoreductase
MPGAIKRRFGADMGLRVWASSGFMTESEVLALAPVVERLGFDGMTFPDHLFLNDAIDGRYPHSADGKPPFSPTTPWPDALGLIGALGTMTTRLRFATSVYVLPLRHPVVVAKAAATTARLCEGRFVMGVGAGWLEDEFDVLGVNFARRGAVMNEAIDVMRTLWRGGTVEHSGEFFAFSPIVMEPSPPHIPIIIGGLSAAALRRAATRGDGYIMPTQPFEQVSDTLRALREALAKADRDEGSLEIFMPALDAPADVILETLEPAINNVTVMPWPHPGKEQSTVDEKLEHLERYAETVLAALRAGVPA